MTTGKVPNVLTTQVPTPQVKTDAESVDCLGGHDLGYDPEDASGRLQTIRIVQNTSPRRSGSSQFEEFLAWILS